MNNYLIKKNRLVDIIDEDHIFIKEFITKLV